MDKIKDIGLGDNVVRISFQMQIGDLINSEIMQIMPVKFAKELTDILFGNMSCSTPEPVEQKIETQKESPPNTPPPAQESRPAPVNTRVEIEDRPSRQINVIQPRYESFDDASAQPFDDNKDMLMEIPVELTVELGKVRKQLKDLTKIGAGSLIPLNKVIGEPLSIFANGRCIAKGEVVVVDDSYAVRVTEIFKNK
jgi:flagellar motor switch protein FliN/FliY